VARHTASRSAGRPRREIFAWPRKLPDSSTRVTVRGYADDLGTPAADYELALKRAQAVVAFLQTHGISKSQLLAQGVRLHVPGPVSRSVTIFIWEDPGNG
jgi:hypothetical protein